MVCEKCGYNDIKGKQKFGINFCSICFNFVPPTKEEAETYISEKIDWKLLETFRNFSSSRGKSQKEGMSSSAQTGKLVTRPPLGYSVEDGKLIPNEKALKVHQIFREFSRGDISLNKLSARHNLSVNGLKKILTNRTYLGEIKFNKKIYPGNHKAIIDEELFYLVDRILKN